MPYFSQSILPGFSLVEETWENREPFYSEREEVRAVSRLLLPFTHGIDEPAIQAALSLAKRLGATLVLLSLIRIPERAKGRAAVRLEDIQQSIDFMEFVHNKAKHPGIVVERVELHTHNPVRSIEAFAREIECAGIAIFVRQGSGVLLSTLEVKQLLTSRITPLYLANLPSNRPGSWLFEWLTRIFTKSNTSIVQE